MPKAMVLRSKYILLVNGDSMVKTTDPPALTTNINEALALFEWDYAVAHGAKWKEDHQKDEVVIVMMQPRAVIDYESERGGK